MIIFLSVETCTHFHWKHERGASVPTWQSTYTAHIYKPGHKAKKLTFCKTALDEFYRLADSHGIIVI